MNGMNGATEEHPTSVIFSRSDQLKKHLFNLCSDVERIEQALLGAIPPKDPEGKSETPKLPFLEDVKFRLAGHIREVERIHKIVSTIKRSLINEVPTIQ